jgi:phosphatidylserine synthase
MTVQHREKYAAWSILQPSRLCAERQMLDSTLRPLIDPPLGYVARGMRRLGVSANVLSVLGAFAGAGAGAAIAAQRFGLAVALFVVSRLLDGLDGAVARIHGPTAFGGYLDSVCDYVCYAAIPLGFALALADWALPAAVLLASFILSGASFLAFAAVAAPRGLKTERQGRKSFYYLAGLAEGTETIVVFILMMLQPKWFTALAYGFAAICTLTVFARLASARRLLPDS